MKNIIINKYNRNICKCFSTTSIALFPVYPNETINRSSQEPLENVINNSLNSASTTDSKALILYIKKYEELSTSFWGASSDTSNYEESFPWLVDTNGKSIPLDKELSFEEGMEIVVRYLQLKNLCLSDNESENIVKLSELLQQYYQNERPKLLKLLGHIDTVYNDSKNKLVYIADDTVNTGAIQSVNSKPLGELGEQTLNQVVIAMDKQGIDYSLLSKMSEYVNIPRLISTGLLYKLMLWGVNTHVLKAKIPQQATKATADKIILDNVRFKRIFNGVIAPTLLVSYVIYHSDLLGPRFKNFTVSKVNIETKNISGSLAFLGMHINSICFKQIN